MPNSNSALFVQPYSLRNDAVTGYNGFFGVCAKVVFTSRRHPSVSHVRVLYGIQTAEDIIKHLSRPGSSMILVFDPQALILNSRRTPSSGVQNTQGRLRFWIEIAVYLGNGRR